MRMLFVGSFPTSPCETPLLQLLQCAAMSRPKMPQKKEAMDKLVQEIIGNSFNHITFDCCALTLLGRLRDKTA